MGFFRTQQQMHNNESLLKQKLLDGKARILEGKKLCSDMNMLNGKKPIVTFMEEERRKRETKDPSWESVKPSASISILSQPSSGKRANFKQWHNETSARERHNREIFPNLRV